MTEEYSAKSIKVISGVEAVRKRPGMYFGDLNAFAINKAIYEIVANSVDQYLSKQATKINLIVQGNVITLTDNGRGLPFEEKSPNELCKNLVEYNLTTLHYSATSDNHYPHVHFCGSGVGLAAVNAVAKSLVIESGSGTGKWKQKFGRGKILSSAVLDKNSSFKGTRIQLVLDQEIFGTNLPNLNALRKSMFELAHFFPGLLIQFQSETFFPVSGLLDLAYLSFDHSMTNSMKQFFYQGRINDVQVQVAALGEADKTVSRSWVNGDASIAGGSHVDAMLHLFGKVGYRPKIALIHVVMHAPQFAGPCKDRLVNEEIASALEELLSVPISEQLT